MKPRILPIFAVFALLLFAANSLQACECSEKETVDQKFERSENVLVARLRSVDRPREEFGLEIPGKPVPLAHLSVERVFKGRLKTGAELRFLQDGKGDCDREFYEDEVDAEFLLYMGPEPAPGDLWTVSLCSRSARLGRDALNSAPADILYLEKFAQVRGRTRLSGRLRQNFETADEGQDRWLEGHDLLISGKDKNIRVKTDSAGVFEVYGLPPGKYRITPEKISGYGLENRSLKEVVVPPGGHVEQDFTFTIKNSISGFVVDATGRRVEKGVILMSIDDVALRKGRRTGKDGTFTFENVPAGRYILSIKPSETPTTYEPYGATFYPGSATRQNAGVIVVGPGSVIVELQLTVPEPKFVTLSGVLLYEDGFPAAQKPVRFTFDDFKSHEDLVSTIDVTTDEKGRFELRAIKGVKGVIAGYLWADHLEECPKLRERVFGANPYTTVYTNGITLESAENRTGIELKLPVPACKP